MKLLKVFLVIVGGSLFAGDNGLKRNAGSTREVRILERCTPHGPTINYVEQSLRNSYRVCIQRCRDDRDFTEVAGSSSSCMPAPVAFKKCEAICDKEQFKSAYYWYLEKEQQTGKYHDARPLQFSEKSETEQARETCITSCRSFLNNPLVQAYRFKGPESTLSLSSFNKMRYNLLIRCELRCWKKSGR